MFLLSSSFNAAFHFYRWSLSISLLPSLFLSISRVVSCSRSLYSFLLCLSLLLMQRSKKFCFCEALSGKKEFHCFDKCFKSKLCFIALKQIIDEKCLFASTDPFTQWLVLWGYHSSVPYTMALCKLTLLTPVATRWEKSTARWICCFVINRNCTEWFCQKQRNLWKLIKVVSSKHQCCSYRLLISDTRCSCPGFRGSAHVRGHTTLLEG